MKNKLVTIIEKDIEKTLKSIDLSQLDNKKILITGASGLIGTYFIAAVRSYVLKHKKSVTLFAVIQNPPTKHLKVLLDFPGVHTLQGDITSDSFLASLPKTDFTIHAAGYGQPGKFMEDQVKTLKLNTIPTFALLEKLKPKGKFLFLSTSEVYSGLPNPPYKEEHIGITNTTHHRSCYIESKRCGEAICNAFRSRGVDAKSARLSLAYGPGTKIGDARVINSFIEKGINGKIELLDHGQASRTYCYVTDAVEIMWNILFYGDDPIYNVGGISKTTIGELAEIIGSHLNVTVVYPKNSKAIEGAPQDVSLDMSKVRMKFKKTTFVPLKTGLRITIDWQKELYKQNNK